MAGVERRRQFAGVAVWPEPGRERCCMSRETRLRSLAMELISQSRLGPSVRPPGRRLTCMRRAWRPLRGPPVDRREMSAIRSASLGWDRRIYALITACSSQSHEGGAGRSELWVMRFNCWLDVGRRRGQSKARPISPSNHRSLRRHRPNVEKRARRARAPARSTRRSTRRGDRSRRGHAARRS